MIPKYIKLKESINEKILSGEYPLGAKLPTELQLSEEYAVSRSTVRQALELLEENGIISKHWGSGNTVIAKSDSSKKNIIRIIVPSVKSFFYENFTEDIETQLLKEGFQVEILETMGQFSVERQYLSEMLNDVYGGLIIQPTHSSLNSTNEDLLQILLKRQTPVVFINSAPGNLYNPTIISADNYARGYQMARHFINGGHRNLGGIFLQDDIASLNAFSGFIDALRDANFPIIDTCFLFCNSFDYSGMSSRSDDTINAFIKASIKEKDIDVIYIDDMSLYSHESFSVERSNLELTKSFGKEIAKAFISLKKNGNSKSITIPYK